MRGTIYIKVETEIATNRNTAVAEEVIEMKKTMYSLILAEDVVNAVDKLADEEGTNRSNLINQILAEYVSVTTPEKRILDVFRCVESLMHGAGNELPVYFANHDNTLSIKSSLAYRYRPTIRYEVELYRVPKGTIGELKVNFRTQAPELLAAMTEFFSLWRNMEEIYVTRLLGDKKIEYSLDENKWTRSLYLPKDGEYAPESVGTAISDYVRSFDRMMKKYLAGEYENAQALENDYLAALGGGMMII